MIGAVVLLAAGPSRRLGRPKQLLELGGEPLVRRMAGVALAADVGRVIVVVGAYRMDVESAVQCLPVRVVHAERWDEGMGASLARGLSLVPADAAFAIAMPCDQPFVTPGHLRRLVDAWRSSGKSLVASTYGGAVGVPALFDGARFAELFALPPAAGAGALLRRAGEGVATIPFDDAALDVDTEADVGEAMRRASLS